MKEPGFTQCFRMVPAFQHSCLRAVGTIIFPLIQLMGIRSSTLPILQLAHGGSTQWERTALTRRKLSAARVSNTNHRALLAVAFAGILANFDGGPLKLRLVKLSFAVLVSAGTVVAQQLPFQRFPAIVHCAKPAPLRLETPLAQEHASKIRAAVHRCPNFAGHYTVVNWGCGTECAVYVIVDNRTGNIYAPPEISRGVSLGLGGPDFRPDSTLMVVANCPEPKVYGLKGCQKNFYRWDGSRLVLLKSEPALKTLPAD